MCNKNVMHEWKDVRTRRIIKSNPTLHKCFAPFAVNASGIPAYLSRKRIRGQRASLVLGSLSIDTAEALCYRHPAFVPQLRDGASELSQRLGSYHDAGVQTLGAGNATLLQYGY